MSKCLLFFLLTCSSLLADVKQLPGLPLNASVTALRLDSTGNIYAAGTLNGHAYAAKLSSDASQIVWMTKFAGSANDAATAIALGADGSVYLAGVSSSDDFPTTPGSWQ